MKKMTMPSPWKFAGGRLCLDFVNSVGGRRESSGLEGSILDNRLVDYSDLTGWSKARGVLTPGKAARLSRLASTSIREAGLVLQRAIGFREALFRIFKAVSDGRKPADADLEILNREYREARNHQNLIYRPEGVTLVLDSEIPRLDEMLWPVALSGADLLLLDDSSRLHQCAGENCGWLFYDESKNGSRHWCDMRTCGTVEKVRRFRKRHTSAS